ncbi:MAG: methyltransferase domain-containing protein [Pseudomonadota bacterium]
MTDGFYNEAMARQQEKVAMTGDMRAQRQVILDLLNLQAGQHVLDVGAGNGIAAREFEEIVGSAGRVCGIDSAEAMVAMARAFCPGGDFRLGDATSLPFADASFDALTTSQLLCFVPDRAAALAEMFRVLRPGGRLVVLDTDWASLVYATRRPDLLERVVAMLTEVYASAHVPRLLTAELLAAGFEVVARRAHPVVSWDAAEDSYAGQLVRLGATMMASDARFTPEDRAAWTADHAALVAEGRFLFALTRFLFSARRPV